MIMIHLLTLICSVFYLTVEAGINELPEYESITCNVEAFHKNVVIGVGKMIELQCDVSRLMPNVTVNWHKSGLLLNELEHERIRVVGSKLIIRPAQYVDHGFYKCDANDEMLSGSQSFSIEIISIFHEFEGDQVTFVCLPGGDHTNAYSWYHGNKLLSWDIKRDLTIRNMTRSHAGNYKCLTTPGDHTAAVIKLFVHPKPKLRVLVQGNTLLWEDQSFHLSCDVLNLEGPVTYYKWYKNDIIIDVTASGIYNVHHASVHDNGKYTCEIMYFDSVFKSSELIITVTAKPCLHVLVQETASPWSGQSFKLLCDVQNVDYRVADYKWYKNGIIINYVKSKIYDVVGASMDDTGKYNCEIQYFNMVFKSPELQITVKARPQVRVHVQETTWLWEDQSLDLSCDVVNLEDPISYYTWYKDGIIIDGTESRIYEIYDASTDNTGNYSCEIQYFDMVFKSPELEITVKSKPQIRLFVQETTPLWEDESFDLLCDVSNLDDRVTYYIWAKDDIVIMAESGIYSIYNASVDDTGYYSCGIETLDSVFGPSELHITVQAKPQLRVIVQEGTASPWRYESFHLLCDVENLNDIASPYKWYKDGIIIDHIESRYYNVSDASMDDTGNYSCGIKYLDKVFASLELQITVKAEPQLHTIVHEGTASPTVHESFHLLCNVENLDDPILHYKWYKDGIRIDQIESRIYDVYDASMDDTGNYSCEIEYFDRVFKSSELQITVKECDKKVPNSINLFILIDTHGKYRQHLNIYQNFSFNIAKILDESYNSTVKVTLGVAIFDHQYERLVKFGKYGPVTGLNKKLLEKKIAKIMALNDSKIHHINMADAVEKSIAEFREDQIDDQVGTKNILVILRKSIECNDCDNNLKKSLDMARMRNVEVILVTPSNTKKSPIGHRILYNKKDRLKSAKQPLLEMIRKLASSFCRNG